MYNKAHIIEIVLVFRLMTDCEFAISNAEGFMEVLARDLSLLDGENVQCVLASEAQVESLMQQLELAISEAEKIENRLDSYDEILRHIRDTMKNMEKKNMMIEVADRNNSRLLQELEKIVVRFICCPILLGNLLIIFIFMLYLYRLN